MRINNLHWLLSSPIAHRGLWTDEIVENSITAFNNAIKEGYPIEIDVHLSSDGEIFVFHDHDLERLTGKKGKIYQLDSEKIKSLSIVGSKEKIPTLDEVLSLIDGKVPILIEIKQQENKVIVDKVVEKLANYSGQVAIQSFNPLYIIRLKKIAPNIIRGILGTKLDTKNAIRNFVLKNMPLNFLAKPDFISYRFTDLPIKTKVPVIGWTLTNQSDYDSIKNKVSNIIFENFIPKK